MSNFPQIKCSLATLFLSALLSHQTHSAIALPEVIVPAFTAYLSPEVNGARVSARSGITGWTDPALKVQWFGEIKVPGHLDCSITLRPPAKTDSKLRLTVAGT